MENTAKLKLTEEWDKTFPKSERVNHRKVTFSNRYGITLAADLYEPKGKEGKLAAVDFLSEQEKADPQRIGIIGICGWGGLALNAAALDTRIKATVASTMYDMSRVNAKGYFDAEDLDYGNNRSRSSLEMNDPDTRPSISGSVENMEHYDIIFLGYPIWWGDSPRIIASFMESYDFSQKTIVPFCTSGGSGIGSSAKNLHGLAASDVTWLDGERLKSTSSRDDLVNWINGLGLDVTAE